MLIKAWARASASLISNRECIFSTIFSSSFSSGRFLYFRFYIFILLKAYLRRVFRWQVSSFPLSPVIKQRATSCGVQRRCVRRIERFCAFMLCNTGLILVLSIERIRPSLFGVSAITILIYQVIIIFLPGSGSGLGGGGGLAKDVSFWWKPKRFYFDWHAFNCGPEIAESFSFSSESSEWTLGVPGGGKDGLASVLQHFLRPLPFRAFKWRAFGAWKLIPSTVLYLFF